MTLAVTVVDGPRHRVGHAIRHGVDPAGAAAIPRRPHVEHAIVGAERGAWMSSPPGSLLVMLTSSTAVGCPFGHEAVMAALTVTILLLGGQITFGDSCNAIAGGSDGGGAMTTINSVNSSHRRVRR